MATAIDPDPSVPPIDGLTPQGGPDWTPGPAQTLVLMATEYRVSQLVYVAAKLGIADILRDGPRECAEIAAAAGAVPDALRRVMRGLVTLGVFEQRADGRYAQNAYSEPLRSDLPKSVRSAVIYWGQEQFRAWAELLETVRSGEPAFLRLFGDPYQYYDRHPEVGDAFDSFMTLASSQVAESVARTYPFPPTGTVVDVAGGEGMQLAAVLKARPGLDGILLDRATVVEKARRLFESEGLLDRCRLVAGDCRESVPAGGAVYLLKNVLHDWDDAGARRILESCARAMDAGARLLVIQYVMPDGPGISGYPRRLVEADLMQLVYHGGRERTKEEYRALLAPAGLELSGAIDGSGSASILVARRS